MSYLMVDPIYTTVIENDRPNGMLMIGIGIEMPDADRARGKKGTRILLTQVALRVTE